MRTILVVVTPFADYQIGDRITDQTLVAQIVAAHPHSVQRINVEDEALADPKPAAPVAEAAKPAAPEPAKPTK